MPRIFGSASTGSGGTPGGSATQVQFNNAGAFGGITGATTDGTTMTLVAPVLGTPASATLTNATGLPPSTGLSTFVAPLKGGLGAALVPVIGDLLYADSTTSFARIAAPAVGQVLKSNGVGVAPSWSAAPSLTGLTVGAGTSGALPFNFATDTTTGIYKESGSRGVAFVTAGSLSGYFDTGGKLVISNGLLDLPNNSTLIRFGASDDLGLSRISAGVIGVGTGAQGSVAGGLQAATLTLSGELQGKAGAYGNPSYRFGSGGSNMYGNASSITFVTGGGTGLLSLSDNQILIGGNADLYLSRPGAATLQHGAADAASPVAQTIKFQDVVAGTSNTAGVNATIQAPAGTGTGAGGSLIFQVAPAGSTGTAKNAQETALTIDSTKLATFAGGIVANAGIQVNNSNTVGWVAGGYVFGNASTGALTGTTRIVAGGGTSALNFGGDTSSFPTARRNGTTLQIKLADDSAFTAIQGKLTTDTAYTAGDPTTTGYLLVYDSTGTAYRVPALLN